MWFSQLPTFFGMTALLVALVGLFTEWVPQFWDR